MDYAVGSVADLISGNVTPNRPRLIKRALTPIKHQQSPNVTPKSELVDDRSIFLSPTMQKKKAIVKKSPKRIFQNPDLDVTNDGEEKPVTTSPKVEKIKKHLKEDLDEVASHKSPKKGKNKHTSSTNIDSPTKKSKINNESIASELQAQNENTPKKKKKQRNSISFPVEEEKRDKENLQEKVVESNLEKTAKKRKKNSESENTEEQSNTEGVNTEEVGDSNSQQQSKKKNKKKNKKNKLKNEEIAQNTEKNTESKMKKKSKSKVNPNAITNEESDSEHESDDEINSETEDINEKILGENPADDSSDDEVHEEKIEKEEKNEFVERNIEDETRRTIFVGNVPYSPKIKKEIKTIFNKYGTIETVRIRNIPVKDARVTPKVAVITNELHPERSTVNIYIKFKDVSSVDGALAENNTVLKDHKLRVTRSDTTGSEHDPRHAVFVGNLPFALEDDAFREKFEACGQIESVRIIRDGKTNAGKGFGYINFASKDSVELALAMSEEDLTIKNRILRVKRCTITTNQQQSGKQGKRNQFQGKNSGKSGNFNQGKNSGKSGNFNQGNSARSGNFNQSQGNNSGKSGRFNQVQSGNSGRPPFRGGKGPNNFQRPSQNKFQGGRPGQNRQFQERQGPQQRGPPQDGAFRRIQKRQNEESAGGPPNKMARNISQPREKKPRKEFVGMTAEKKKKQKFSKGQKKKKALSEILTKKSE